MISHPKNVKCVYIYIIDYYHIIMIRLPCLYYMQLTKILEISFVIKLLPASQLLPASYVCSEKNYNYYREDQQVRRLIFHVSCMHVSKKSEENCMSRKRQETMRSPVSFTCANSSGKEVIVRTSINVHHMVCIDGI